LTIKVRSSLSADELAAMATRQLNNLFPDGQTIVPSDISGAVPGALERLEHCFSYIGNKYFFDGRQVVFDHLHGDQYAMWLYLLSNEIYLRNGPSAVCKKLFLLNKALHGCDIYYEVELPSVFLLVHPLGTVLGRGRYADFFIAYQRVGVGSNHDVYPILGRYLTLHPGSAVLGNSMVGDHCTIATESLLLDRELPANSIYIGSPRDSLIKPHVNNTSIWRT
jgi:serine O-acetyltransferase